MTDFEGVVPALGKALTKRGYTELTPVQEAVLAPDLEASDALVSAQTGSGKTVAFGLALAPNLLNDQGRFIYAKAPTALIVAPTRELALQVKRELEWLYEMTGAVIASCVGGMDMRAERRVLDRGAHMVVGTPGRLRDHIERGSLDSGSLKAVVLDEADEMLDLGFREDLEYLLEAAPSERRTLMFSATVPRPIANLAKRYQRDAVRITTAAEKKQHLDIEYKALAVAPNDRENAIVNVLRYYEAKTAIVFCATRATVNHMTSRFANRGFSVVALSGELTQSARTHALQAMRDGRARVCIATDVAARGIDLPNLELVIHADLPKSREPLLHRSGRTGRAGRKGVSALIVPYNWRKRVERLLQSANIEAKWEKPPTADEIMARDRERILQSDTLTGDLSEFEYDFAQELIAKHGPEQVAAAFVRQHLSGLTAPEELLDGPSGEKKKKERVEIKNGVWVSLTVGHEQSAEPRWLLPMLCRAGHITKREIGSIKIFQKETFVELAQESVDRFLDSIGPDGAVEENVKVSRVGGPPEEKAERKHPREKQKQKPKKKPQKDRAKKTRQVDPEIERELAALLSEGKPKKAKKSKVKKPRRESQEKVDAGLRGQPRFSDQPGSRPLKRKKTKRP